MQLGTVQKQLNYTTYNAVSPKIKKRFFYHDFIWAAKDDSYQLQDKRILSFRKS